jgi:RNA-directed DNA polymerase
MISVTKKRWDGVAWRKLESDLHRIQKRIHHAELQGDKRTVSKLQQHIVASFHAKLLAVRQVAQTSPGRRSAGPDGIKSPSRAEMYTMAEALSIRHRPSPVRRKLIAKPGKTEKRPLGIPNLIDRAQQALIAMALGPQWEAHFSEHQYGFRKGRSPHDAVDHLVRHLRRSGPKAVLDADIEKFFDRIDHDALIARLDAPQEITLAIRRIIKAGALADGEFVLSDIGTPQGGPLSPLLANIALAGLESHLKSEFRTHFAGRINALGYPHMVIYADDLLVLHKDQAVIEWSRMAITSYLTPLGLRLSDDKTRVVPTTTSTPGMNPAGFDFLGFHFQHHTSSRRKTRGIRTLCVLATPSNAAQKKFYAACAERIDSLKLSRKHRGARQARQAEGKRDPVTLMIFELNRMITGWGNYFRIGASTHTFSRMDHLLHQKLWQWAVRRFDNKGRKWIVERVFSGIGTDRRGKPLMRKDGTPRQCAWVFKSPFAPNDQKHETLSKLAHIHHKDHDLVRPDVSYYGSGWCYWQKRTTRRYPGTPPMISAPLFHRQRGKCSGCRIPFQPDDRIAIAHLEGKKVLIHTNCSKSSK